MFPRSRPSPRPGSRPCLCPRFTPSPCRRNPSRGPRQNFSTKPHHGQAFQLRKGTGGAFFSATFREIYVGWRVYSRSRGRGLAFARSSSLPFHACNSLACSIPGTPPAVPSTPEGVGRKYRGASLFFLLSKCVCVCADRGESSTLFFGRLVAAGFSSALLLNVWSSCISSRNMRQVDVDFAMSWAGAV